MTDPRLLALLCALIALANAVLLLAPPSRAEQRLWRALRVQSVRHWLTRRSRRGEPHRGNATIALARRNILWHFVLTMILAAVILHPRLVAAPWRGVAYTFIVAGAVAYLAGSIVQRQKILIVVNRARVSLSHIRGIQT